MPGGGGSGSFDVGEVEAALVAEADEALVGVSDSFDEGGFGERAEGGAESGIVETGGDGELSGSVGDEGLGDGGDLAEGGDEGFDGDDLAAEVEGGGALEGFEEGFEEDFGDVGGVLEILESAVGDGVGPVDGDGFDGLCGFAGEAEVASDAVDGPGSEADAGEAVVEPVDAGVELVADLEGAVMGGGEEAGVVGDGGSGCVGGFGGGFGRGFVVAGAVDGGGAGVDDSLDLVLEGEGGFEDGEGSEDVDAGAEEGFGAADGDLEAGEVDDVGGLDGFGGGAERG